MKQVVSAFKAWEAGIVPPSTTESAQRIWAESGIQNKWSDVQKHNPAFEKGTMKWASSHKRFEALLTLGSIKQHLGDTRTAHQLHQEGVECIKRYWQEEQTAISLAIEEEDDPDYLPGGQYYQTEAEMKTDLRQRRLISVQKCGHDPKVMLPQTLQGLEQSDISVPILASLLGQTPGIPPSGWAQWCNNTVANYTIEAVGSGSSLGLYGMGELAGIIREGAESYWIGVLKKHNACSGQALSQRDSSGFPDSAIHAKSRRDQNFDAKLCTKALLNLALEEEQGV
jgi:hypothetical protein